jgi:hypothetical protein
VTDPTKVTLVDSHKPGTDWEEISERLGPPVESERSGLDGFKVLYSIGGPASKQVWLVFDRGHKLVSKVGG